MNVSATPSIERIHHLMRLGCSLDEIAAAAGVSRTFIAHLSSHRLRKVSHHNEALILAARPLSERVGATRKLQALAVMGWSAQHIADHAGITLRSVGSIRRHTPERIRPDMLDRIDAAWRALAATPGPSHQARACARRNRWAPPLAWDEIRDPQEEPKGVGHVVSLKPRGVIDELEHHLLPCDVADACRALGIPDEGTLHRRLLRANRLDLWRQMRRQEAAA